MSKFIIIDHSLCNLQGHHYECSVSVAEAAGRLGYHPIIIANRAFPKPLHPKNIEVIPAFDVDWFDQVISFRKLPTWLQYLNKTKEFWQNHPLEKLRQIKEYYFLYWGITQPKLRLFLEKVEGSTTRLWSWIQQDLQLLRYIPLSNTFWGITKIIWGLFRFILNIAINLIERIWQKFFEFKPSSFRETLSKTLEQVQPESEDHILIHTLGIEQLEALFYYLESCDRACLPHYHILLRRDIEDPLVTQAKGMGLKTCLHRFYESELWPNCVTFYTDTENLVKRHNSLSPIEFVQMPIPFRQEKLKNLPQEKNSQKPIHLVYLGDARPEKGYQHLPDLVEKLWIDYLQPGKIKFTIQSNFNIQGGELGILEARLKLEQYPSSKVSLIKTPMNADDYYELLGNADLVILLYDQKSYAIRTSGVLTESLAAGKPVVVPSNTWLSKQVDLSRATIYEHPDEIANAVIRILENFEHFSEAAYKYQWGWREQNSPDTLVKLLISEKNFTALGNEVKIQSINLENKPPTILFMLEGDALIHDSKLSNISLQHLDYVSRCGYQIYVIFFSKNKVYREEKFDLFVTQIKAKINSFAVLQYWILEPNSFPAIIAGVDVEKYIKDLQENKPSLIRDLVEVSNLDIPLSLIQFLQTQKIDVIFLNSIISYPLIEKLGLEKKSIICEISRFQSHYYALDNHRDLDEEEFQLECKMLKKSSVILAHNSQEGEKIQELIKHSLVYSLTEDYYKLINDIFAAVLKDRALQLDSFEKSKKIAILYPWGDILERQSGASQRSGLLIDYLKSQNYSLWVFSIGEEQDFWRNHIHYSYYEPNFLNFPLIKQVYQDAYQSWEIALNLSQSQLAKNSIKKEDLERNWLPWIYYQFRFDPEFIQRIEMITDWANVVILEYPFWATIVGKICHQKKIKLLITAHDILAQQLKDNSLLSQIALAEEINGLKQADYVIAVSESDREFFSQYGLNVQSIPHAINLEQIDSLILQDFSDNLPEKCLAKNFCLFVGSNHTPNVEAVKKIRHLAEDDSLKTSLNFIIVGNCCEPEETDNFLALSKVNTQILIQLYQQSVFVISPLLSGTGASVKIIEAMAYGKVILGTSIAFRGYPVQSGIHCLICDELTKYPQIINDLLKQPEQIKEISKKARELAETYDYHRLYSLYGELIG